jgi:fucose permease
MLPDVADQHGADPHRAAKDADDAGRCSPTVSRWSGGMVMLGAIAFASMLCEGATADWASVYLAGPLHAADVESGLGYATFALAMVTVRLSGNRLLTRYRPDRLLPTLAALATVGFSAGLLIGQPAAALVGFACLGVGLASVVPAVFSAAGRIPGLHPGTAVATASACGWAGFVCGPPLIGRLASLSSLSTALFLLPALTGFVVIATSIARALKPQPAPSRHPLTAGASR